jgi:hypothetical protein
MNMFNKLDIDSEVDEYDHDLIVLLETLKKIDLRQFATDLKLNDRDLFKNLKDILNKENDNAR